MNESAVRSMLNAVLLVKGHPVHGDPKSGQISILSLLHINAFERKLK